MKKIKSKDVTIEHIKMVNREIGERNHEEAIMSEQAYAFYYTHIFVNDMSLCDVDRYANLNTILGYDVGLKKFKAIDRWVWEEDYDLMEFDGRDENKAFLQKIVKAHRLTELDYSKWRDLSNEQYTYSYFEDGVEYK